MSVVRASVPFAIFADGRIIGRLRRLMLLLCALVVLLPLAAEDGEDEGHSEDPVDEGPFFPANRDIVQLRSGRPMHTYVMRENRDQLEHRVSPTLPQNQTMRWRDVAEINYADMSGSYYEAGQREMAAGSYELAAIRFRAQVSAGRREWHVALGLWALGTALELNNDHAAAAEAFSRLAEELPEHRFAVDAQYRQGVALALAGRPDEALQVARQLEALRRERNDRAAGMRGQAIEIAVHAVRGDLDAAATGARRLAFSAAHDSEVWFHWGQTWAGMLIAAGRHRDAVDEYRRMLSQGGGADPSQIATLRLGYGLALAEIGDADQALTELAYLEALPYGSPEQRLIALARAGELQWEFGGQLLQQLDHPRRQRYGETLQAMARESLQAAAESPVDHPARSQARTALAALPPLPGQEDEVGATAPAAD